MLCKLASFYNCTILRFPGIFYNYPPENRYFVCTDSQKSRNIVTNQNFFKNRDIMVPVLGESPADSQFFPKKPPAGPVLVISRRIWYHNSTVRGSRCKACTSPSPYGEPPHHPHPGAAPRGQVIGETREGRMAAAPSRNIRTVMLQMRLRSPGGSKYIQRRNTVCARII